MQELERQKVILQSEIAKVRMAKKQNLAELIDVGEAMNLFRRCSEQFKSMTLDEKEALVEAMLKGVAVNKVFPGECRRSSVARQRPNRFWHDEASPVRRLVSGHHAAYISAPSRSAG